MENFIICGVWDSSDVHMGFLQENLIEIFFLCVWGGGKLILNEKCM